ncbi:hypothetical protein E2320_020066, partial [Naja naja]
HHCGPSVLLLTDLQCFTGFHINILGHIDILVNQFRLNLELRTSLRVINMKRTGYCKVRIWIRFGYFPKSHHSVPIVRGPINSPFLVFPFWKPCFPADLHWLAQWNPFCI